MSESKPFDEASLANQATSEPGFVLCSGIMAEETCIAVCWRWHELVLGSSEEREKQAWNAKGKYQARHVEVESTDVCVCGRPLRSSDEVPVMGMERRGWRA